MKQKTWNDNQELIPEVVKALEYKVQADNREIRGKARQYILCEYEADLFGRTYDIPLIYRLHGKSVSLQYCYPLTQVQYLALKGMELKKDPYITTGVSSLMNIFYLHTSVKFSLADGLNFDDAFLFLQVSIEDTLGRLL